MRTVIVGGGIVGLATAYQLTQARPSDEVIVLERDAAVAQHQSSRNSGVLHAGVYYEPGSLKAQLCGRGATLMRAYCQKRGLPFDECGKVIVARDESELPRLDALERRAIANAVPGLTRLDAAQLHALEPHAAGIAALHSPSTAITDFGQIARSLAADVTAAGGTVRCGTDVVRVHPGRVPVIALANGHQLAADQVIVCAGLHADRLARRSGAASEPRIVPFRGEFHALVPARRELVRGLIYPVPDPRLPFLGIHLTRRIDGSVWLGPNAVFAGSLEGYERRAFSARELFDLALWPGTWRLGWQQRRTALAEWRRSRSTARFVAAAAAYVPGLTAADVQPAAAGVRAQAVERNGTLVDDFRLERTGRIAWVRNAPSPAATSSLALAEELLERVGRGPA